MANYNQLKTRAQQVRDEQTIGGNTALRVGQLLMDMVDAESETVDNIVELFTGTEDNPVIPTLPNPGLLHWLQSPIVALVSMGEDLDGDAGAVVQEGDLYYYNHSGYQIFVKGSGSLPGTGYKARQKVLYLNKYTGKLYEWTGADMSEIVLSGTGGGGGNVTIEEGQDYIDITIDDNVPVIEVSTQSIVMSGQTKTATFTVSGHNLTAPIRINGGNAYFSKSPSSISPVGGIVEATTVTVTFGGDSDDTDDLIVSSVGAASKTVHVTYTAVAGPTILADNTLTIKAAAGQSNTGQLAVTGLNLTAGITASVSGTGFTVSASESGTYGSQASLPSSGGTLYVKFSPTGSTASTGTLTLASTGATSKTVDLTGAVATLTVIPSSLSFSTDQNVAATGKFTINGSNLTNGVTLALTDANSVFSLSKNSLTKAEAEAGETITVTYNSSAAGNHSGSIAVNWDGTTQTVSLSGTAAVAATSDSEGKFTKEINGKTLYLKRKIVDGQKTNEVEVHQSNYNTGWQEENVADTYSGNIVIPSTVVVDGVSCNITTIASNSFRFKSKKSQLTSLTLPEGITTIGSYFLFKAQAVTSIIIPSTVTTIGGGFCTEATNIVTIDMRCQKNPNFQTTFGDGNTPCCRHCYKLESFVIPDKVKTITFGSYLNFEGNTAMTEITIGTDMEAFSALFQAATSVTKIYCRGTTVRPKINSTSSTTNYITSTVYENAQVYVPTGYKQAYLDVVDGRTSNGKVWYPFEQYHALIEYNPD